jgi:hypothetical protein
MSAIVQKRVVFRRTSDSFALRDGLTRGIAGGLFAILAIAYAIAIVSTEGDPFLLVPLATALIVVVVLARPAAGIYLLLAAAMLFEQFDVRGVSPITSQARVFQNISAYSEIPIRLSIADLLILLTLASWGVRRIARRNDAPSLGPFGKAVALLGLALAIGLVIGVARGSSWDPNAVLQELRGPVQMLFTFFLATNLVRDRGQLVIVAWEFIVLAGVKAFQGIFNYQESLNLPYGLDAVTGHEDVIFFDLAVALLVALTLLGNRGRLTYALLCVVPLALSAELFTERRVGFIALGAALAALAVLGIVANPRRALTFAAVGGVAVAAYMALFWNEGGPLGQPVRAVRGVIEPASLSSRDASSNNWRDIENRNISFTMRQLPLTGVGVGQEYLFQEEPPSLGWPKFVFWRNITHNSAMWFWLKAGPLGAFALWFLIARVLLVSASLYTRLRDPWLRWMVTFPLALVAIHVTFSAVDLGFMYSRTMIFFGVALGLGAALVRQASATDRQAD